MLRMVDEEESREYAFTKSLKFLNKEATSPADKVLVLDLSLLAVVSPVEALQAPGFENVSVQ